MKRIILVVLALLLCPSAASAVFPTIAGPVTSAENSDTTSHTINLPTGIVAGNLLLILFESDGNETITCPSGWTKEAQSQNATTFAACWKKATGSEGATETITTSTSEQSAAIALRIIDSADPDTSPPQFSTPATGTSELPDPASLTPAGGAKNYLWLAVAGGDNTSATIEQMFGTIPQECRNDA